MAHGPNPSNDGRDVLEREYSSAARGNVRTAFLTWPTIAVVALAAAVATCLFSDKDRDRDLLAKETLVGNVGWVKSVAYTADGGMLFSSGMNGAVASWDLTTHPRPALLPAGLSSVQSMIVSPASSLVAAAHGHTPVSLHHVGNGETRVRALEDELGETVDAACLAFSKNGSALAVGQSNGKVTLWDSATGRKRRTLCGHDGVVASVAFAPDCATLASSGSGHATRIWDLSTGKERFAITSPVNTYAALAFSSDGRLLFLGDHATPVVRVWDLVANNEQAVLEGANGAVIGLAISPDGATLAAADYQGSVTLWDLGTLSRREERLTHAGVRSLAFAPDGNTLATGGFDGTIHLWAFRHPFGRFAN